MATLIDWSTVDAEVRAALNEPSCENRSQALAEVELRVLFGMTRDEIEDAITDGANDRGIDAVVIRDADVPPTVHLFQVKCVDGFDGAKKNFKSNEIDKVLSFIDDLLQKEKSMEKTCNALLWAKVREIWDLFENGNVRFEVHFVGNQAAMVSTQQQRVEKALGRHRSFTVHHVDLGEIATSLVQQRQPKVDAEISLIDNQYFERSDGNIRGLIGTVAAGELVKLVTDPSSKDRVRPIVFDQNVRVYLSRKNRINQRIYETALSTDNAAFWYLNNGVTMTCESFDYRPGSRAPRVRLKGVQIVNGGQTTNALFEAAKKDMTALSGTLVLLRVYELKDPEMAGRVAESTNSQTPIRSRDLRANDDVQRKLEVALAAMGWFYERKADQHRDRLVAKRLDALAASQAYVAYFHNMPEVATKDRGKIFGELYDSIFNEDLGADQLVAATQVLQPVVDEKRVLEASIRKGKAFDKDRLFLIDGAYYVLYALGVLADSAKVPRASVVEVQALLPKAMEVMTKVVKEERKKDPAFAHKKFFKTARARQIVEGACKAI